MNAVSPRAPHARASDSVRDAVGAQGRKLRNSSPLVNYRNNFDAPSQTHGNESAFRVPRPYVQRCMHSSLGLFYEGGRVVFKPLMCGSWSCQHCRKVNAAKLLDRLRAGMTERQVHRSFVTLTLNPQAFGSKVIGQVTQRDGRITNQVSEPTVQQFARASKSMSKEFKKLMDRLNRKATRQGLERLGYFRVIELHRNGWPHYHVIFEHSHLTADDFQDQVSSWSLGRSDIRSIDLESAVSEVAPYLVSKERGKGHKAYQFAATALPKNFRLYSSSKGFLGAARASETEPPVHAQVLRGHWTSFKKQLEHYAQSFPEKPEIAWVCPPPADEVHKPPSAFQTSGDAAVVYYSELVSQAATHAPSEWFEPLVQLIRKERGAPWVN